MQIILNALFLLGSLQSIAPAKILFLFTHSLPSHYRAFSPIIDGLAAKGHQITAYIHPRFKKKKPISNLKEVIVDPQVKLLEDVDFISWRNKSGTHYTHTLWNTMSQFTDGVLRTSELKALMQSSEKFDLVMIEATYAQECYTAFGHKFNAPVINMHPLIMAPLPAQLAGQPHSFSYIPDFRLSFTDQMTLWERVQNTVIGLHEMIGGHFYYLPFIQEPMMRRHFRYPGSETLPSLKELLANMSLHLVDSHPVMSYVRPYSSNVIEIAGTQVKQAGKLPQDLQKFMDEATEGAIYFSFGSFMNVKKFPPYLKQIFVETLKGLKQRVIWKWDEGIPGAPNIITKSWLPQQEILCKSTCIS